MKQVYLYSIIAVVIIGVGGWYFFNQTNADDANVFCTMDAKECADGSFVGRTGPNCEFEACPTEGKTMATISRFDEVNNLRFTYPENLETIYITSADWPPKISVSTEKVPCTGTQKIINNVLYCVKITSEGAAGSVYTDNTYTMQKEGKSVSANVVLQHVNCVNYDEQKRAECETERKTFNLDSIITTILSSVTFEQ